MMRLLFLFVGLLFTAAAGSILSYGNLENAEIDLGDPNSVNNPSNSNSNVQYEEISEISDNPPWHSTRDGRVVDPKRVSPSENLYKAGWNPTKNNPCPNVNTVCCHTTQYFVLVYVIPCWNNYDGALDPDNKNCPKDMIFCCNGFQGNTGYGCWNAKW